MFILSPDDTHFDYLNFFSGRHGKYVFCEKPPVTALDQFETLQADPKKVFFNIREGVQGTGMASWKALDEDETWDVVAYVLSIAEGA